MDKLVDRTLDFYNRQARMYPKIRARPIQRYTDELERATILPYLQGAASVLDLGCGEGRLARWIADATHGQGKSIAASDFSPEMIAIARSLDGERGISYAVGDAMSMTEADSTYDLVVSSTAPNNFPSLDPALSEIHRILKPGGVFIAFIINREETARYARYAYYAPYYLWRAIKRLVRGENGFQYRLYTHDELQELLNGRFDIVRLEGMRYVADWIPEWPLNFWRPLFPLMRGLIEATRVADERLCRSPGTGRHARFHRVVARVRK